jgi:hypothetical protein
MGLRDKVKRLERASREDLASFELLDGSRFYYDPIETAKDLFLHSLDCGLGRDRSFAGAEVPEIYLAVCKAKDPDAVLEQLVPSEKAAWFIELPYERDTLINERRLVLIEREPVEDLSE